MQFYKLGIYTFLQFLFLLALKYWLFNYSVFTEPTQEIVFWVLVGIVAVAMSRRLGVINYLEALFAIFWWIVLDLLLDLFLRNIYSVNIFGTLQYWIGALVLALSVFFFHKKRHIEIRHRQHAHHGGHH